MDLPRVDALTPAQFSDEYLVSRTPVIVTGEVSSWPAARKWTWDWLDQQFGHHMVDVYDDWFVPTATMRLTDFLRTGPADRKRSYVRWFSRNSDAPGRWSDDVFDTLSGDWWQPSFLPAEDYVVPYTPEGLRVDAARDPFPYRGLFVSVQGARTRLHRDPWSGAAALCQLAGTKEVRMYPPEMESALIAAAAAGDAADDGVAPAYSGALRPGEVLFVPDGWWHQVDTVSDSISLTWNFVHRAVSDRLVEHVRSFPDDPELAVVAYFMAGRVPGTSGTTARELVPAAIAP